MGLVQRMEAYSDELSMRRDRPAAVKDLLVLPAKNNVCGVTCDLVDSDAYPKPFLIGCGW